MGFYMYMVKGWRSTVPGILVLVLRGDLRDGVSWVCGVKIFFLFCFVDVLFFLGSSVVSRTHLV